MKYILVSLFCLCIWIPTSVAEPVCRPILELIGVLVGKYGENVIGVGLDSRGFMISIHVNDETSTFTVVTQNIKGSACILSAGEGWRKQQQSKTSSKFTPTSVKRGVP
jgi:hypothetical protein